MNEAQTQLFLEQSEHAFITFQQCTPEFIFSENLARQMAEALKLNGLDPRKPEHLSLAWQKVRPASATAPDNSLEAAARTLLQDTTFSARVREMSAEEFERATHNLAFVRAVELLEPPAPTDRPATRGEAVREAGITELVQRGEIRIAPSVPKTSAQRGVVNLHQAGHIRKLATETQLAAAIRKQKEDDKFQEELALKINQAGKIKAARARR
jgi:hypothetical protein